MQSGGDLFLMGQPAHQQSSQTKTTKQVIHEAIEKFEREGLLKAEPKQVQSCLQGLKVPEEFICTICNQCVYQPLECRSLINSQDFCEAIACK